MLLLLVLFSTYANTCTESHDSPYRRNKPFNYLIIKRYFTHSLTTWVQSCCGTPCQLPAERWELAGKTQRQTELELETCFLFFPLLFEKKVFSRANLFFPRRVELGAWKRCLFWLYGMVWYGKLLFKSWVLFGGVSISIFISPSNLSFVIECNIL